MNWLERFRGLPSLRIDEGCRLTKVGQINDARIIRCRTCGLARLTWPGDSVTCFYRDDLSSRDLKQAQMPERENVGGVPIPVTLGERREAPRYAERFYRVPDGHCFECGLPQWECRCDGL